MTLKLNRVRVVVKVHMFMQNIIELSAAVHMSYNSIGDFNPISDRNLRNGAREGQGYY